MAEKVQRFNLRWAAGFIVAAIVLVVVCFFLHRFQKTKIADAFLREGRRAQADKRPADAIRYLRNYVTLRPTNIDGLCLFGKQLADVGNLSGAYMTYDRVLRLDAGQTASRRAHARLAMQLGRYGDALDDLNQFLLKDAPDDGELLAWKGECLTATRDDDEAIKALRESIEKSPERLETYAVLARVLQFRMNKPDEAKAVMNQMVEKNADRPLAYVSRGLYRYSLLTARSSGQQNQKAPQAGSREYQDELAKIIAEDADKALSLAPKDADALSFATQMYLAYGNLTDARKFATTGLEKYPTDPRLYLLLSDVEALDRNEDKAIQVLKRGVAALPSHGELLYALAVRLLDLKKPDEAEGIIDQLRTAKFNPAVVAYLDARLLLLKDKWRLAVDRFEAVRPLLQDLPALLRSTDSFLALAYKGTGAVDLELTCLRRVVAADPSSVEARRILAKALMTGNLIREAAEQYRTILGLGSTSLGDQLDMARCLLRLNSRRKKAEQEWNDFDSIVTKLESQKENLNVIVPRTAILKAEKLVSMGMDDEAIQEISKAREKYPGDLELWTSQIMLAQSKSDWVRVDELLDQADAQFKDNFRLRVIRARNLVMRFGKDSSARVKALCDVHPSWRKEDAHDFRAHMATLLFAAGDYKEAERLVRISAKDYPNDLYLWVLLFDVAVNSDNKELMKDVVTQVEGITGQGALWHYGQAVYLMMQGKLGENPENLEQARFHLAKAKAERPNWTRIPMLSADIERAIGNDRAAADHLMEAISLGERNVKVLNQAISILYAQKRYLDANTVIQRLQEMHNQLTGEMLRQASEYSLRLNDAGRAMELADQLIRVSDKTGDKVWRALVLNSLKKPDEAEVQLREVLSKDEGLQDAWILLVQTLMYEKKKAEAEQAVIEAEQKMTGEHKALAVAQCYESIGKRDIAKTKFEEALAAAPEDQIVRQRVIEFQLRTADFKGAEPNLRKIFESKDSKVSAQDKAWARRAYCLTVTTTGDPARLNEALSLIGKNLETATPNRADVRVKALILARLPSNSARVEAISILEKLLEQDSETSLDDRALLAGLCMLTGDRVQGATELRNTVVASNNNVRYLVPYLQLLLKSEETSEVDLWLRQLQKVAPDQLVTADIEVQLAFLKEDYSEVALLLEKKVKDAVDKNDQKLINQYTYWAAKRYSEFAKSLYGQNKVTEEAAYLAAAEKLFRRLAELNPAEKFSLVEFFAGGPQVDQALQLLKEGLKDAAPEKVAAIGATIITNPRTTQAQLDELQKLIAQYGDPKNPSTSVALTEANLKSFLGDYDTAVRVYEDVLKRESKNVAALNNLSVLLAMTRRNVSQALDLIQSAIEYGGPNGVLLDTRGMVYYFDGKYKEALNDFEASVKDDQSGDRYFHLALANFELKNSAAAKQALSEAQRKGLSKQVLHPIERKLLVRLRASLGM